MSYFRYAIENDEKDAGLPELDIPLENLLGSPSSDATLLVEPPKVQQLLGTLFEQSLVFG